MTDEEKKELEKTEENQEVEVDASELFSKEQKEKMQEELQKHFNLFKKKLKVKSKSDLIAIIWGQGMEYKRLQEVAQDLYEENQLLKGKTNEKTSESSSEE